VSCYSREILNEQTIGMAERVAGVELGQQTELNCLPAGPDEVVRLSGIIQDARPLGDTGQSA
jgi:hypothetical protein